MRFLLDCFFKILRVTKNSIGIGPLKKWKISGTPFLPHSSATPPLAMRFITHIWMIFVILTAMRKLRKKLPLRNYRIENWWIACSRLLRPQDGRDMGMRLTVFWAARKTRGLKTGSPRMPDNIFPTRIWPRFESRRIEPLSMRHSFAWLRLQYSERMGSILKKN